MDYLEELTWSLMGIVCCVPTIRSSFFSPLCWGRDAAQISVGQNICSASEEVQAECEVKLERACTVCCYVLLFYAPVSYCWIAYEYRSEFLDLLMRKCTKCCITMAGSDIRLHHDCGVLVVYTVLLDFQEGILVNWMKQVTLQDHHPSYLLHTIYLDVSFSIFNSISWLRAHTRFSSIRFHHDLCELIVSLLSNFNYMFPPPLHPDFQLGVFSTLSLPPVSRLHRGGYSCMAYDSS